MYHWRPRWSKTSRTGVVQIVETAANLWQLPTDFWLPHREFVLAAVQPSQARPRCNGGSAAGYVADHEKVRGWWPADAVPKMVCSCHPTIATTGFVRLVLSRCRDCRCRQSRCHHLHVERVHDGVGRHDGVGPGRRRVKNLGQGRGVYSIYILLL